MRRTLAVLAATPLALVALGGPASAAGPDVTHTTYSAANADAYWSSGEGASYIEGTLTAALTRTGPVLDVWQLTPYGSEGFVTTTVTQAKTGFTFTIDFARLQSATLVAENLAGEVCTYEDESDADGDCVPTSLDISVRWTGEGPITSGSSNERFKADGFSINVHSQSKGRDATAAGSITGGTIDVDGFDFASLSSVKYTETKRCTADACEAPGL